MKYSALGFGSWVEEVKRSWKILECYCFTSKKSINVSCFSTKFLPYVRVAFIVFKLDRFVV